MSHKNFGLLSNTNLSLNMIIDCIINLDASKGWGPDGIDCFLSKAMLSR